ncbi:MAG: Mu transposase C-terminal domain-containing protein [Leptolyngbya sp. BL-A-14]
MSSFKLGRNLHFWLDGHEYVIEDRLGNGDLKIRNVLTEEPSSISDDAILKLYEEERFQLEPPKLSNGNKKVKSYKSADFSQISSSLREEAKRRYRYVNAYFERNLQKRNQKTLEPIIEEVSKELREELLAELTQVSEELKKEVLAKLSDFDRPSWISVYRWIKKYEEGGHDVRSLVSNHRAKGDYEPKISQDVIAIINDAINEVYLNSLRPSVRDVCESIEFRIDARNSIRERQGLPPLESPNRTTIYRRVLQNDAYQEMVKRYGRRTADRKNNFSGYEPPQATRPLEEVEIDHTKLPFYIIDGETKLPIGIPTMTSAIDKAFSMPVGFFISFEPPSGLSVMQCLWHAIHPKGYIKKQYPSVTNTWDVFGIMGVLKCDNALEFKKGEQLKDAALQLGFHVDFCPVQVPWYKSRIEGFFHRINSELLRGKPGSYLKFENEFDDEYNAAKNAILTIEDLLEIIHLFIVDIVCQQPHPKFGTPKAELWRKAIDEFPPTLPSSRRDLRILLGTVVERVISRNGIEFEGLYYRSEDLIPLRQIYEQRDKRRTGGTRDREKARIKIDPTDISCVHVYDPTTLEFVRIPAVSQSYTQGLTLWQHRKIKELAARESEKVDIDALIIAKAKIHAVVDRAWRNTKGGRTRSTAARWLGIGLEGVDVGEVENYYEARKLKKQSNSASTDSNICEADEASTSDAPLGDLEAIEGISNFESAFNDDGQHPQNVSSELDSFMNSDSAKHQSEQVQALLQAEMHEDPSTIEQQSNKSSDYESDKQEGEGEAKQQEKTSTTTQIAHPPKTKSKNSSKKSQPKKTPSANTNQSKQKTDVKQSENEPKPESSPKKPDLTGWGTIYRLSP